MNFIDRITGFIPFGKIIKQSEYFFALNIGHKTLSACVWLVESKHLKVLNPAQSPYSGTEELIKVVDGLLDKVLFDLNIEPEKILFGVPDSWLMDDDLKPQNLKILQDLSRYLELKPLAYVATSHSLAHFIEKKEGAPTTGILVGIEKEAIEVTVIRAGKIDGTKVIERSENAGGDIEKALLTFAEVEVLPSRILLYGGEGIDLARQKETLLTHPWMSKLSFLHFPKIELTEENIVINSIAYTGAAELDSEVSFVKVPSINHANKSNVLPVSEAKEVKELTGALEDEDFGFVEGDINKVKKEVQPDMSQPEDFSEMTEISQEMEDKEVLPGQAGIATMDKLPKFPLLKQKKLLIGLGLLILFLGGLVLVPKAEVTIFAEPQILEKDAQVTADPSAKSVDEDRKIIPGEIVSVEVSGSEKTPASGKKEIGDSAKGTVKVINNSTTSSQTITQGATITSGGLKFTLDSTVNVASTSATSDSKSTATVKVTAVAVGPDSNLPSGSQFSLGSNSQIAIVAEGNFSGGTSKTVTVVTDEDQKKLLASLASNLRKQAKDKIQEKLKEKKILEEALSEEITKKSYNKAIGDQASEFSLTLNLKYKGTAYSEDALKEIVSKALSSQIPQDFELNLAETETSADVSKLEKDGKLVFLARFKAKLSPKIDTKQLKSQIRGKTPAGAVEILRKQPHIVGADIRLSPSLPVNFSILPLLDQNIKLEVKLQ